VIVKKMIASTSGFRSTIQMPRGRTVSAISMTSVSMGVLVFSHRYPAGSSL